MKYIITESRLKESIWKYLDKNYGDLNSTCAFDEHGNEDCCAVVFYRGDYSDDEVVFRWYDKCYWSSENVLQAHRNREKSPVLAFEYDSDYETLEGYFGEMWYDTFKEWFQETYGYEVKSL